MRAFHGDPRVKERLLTQLRESEVVQGVYWEKGKGCAVGCTVHSGDHSLYETLYGIPKVIARLEDCIFEGLENSQAKSFPVEFIEAIPVGADLSMVWPKFAIKLLENLEKFDKSASCQEVAGLYKKHVAGEVIPATKWKTTAAANAANANANAYAANAAAANAAYAANAAAAANAAYAANAANAAAAYAAYAAAAYANAAYAAAAYANAAAAAAYDDAAANAAAAAAYKKQATWLLDILKTSPVN